MKKVNPHIRVYCGAGIETKEDLIKAKKLGASGFLAAIIFGENIPTALRWGIAQAESILQKFGATNELLTKKQMVKQCS